MRKIDELLAANREWAEGQRAADPSFFDRLAKGQNPEIFWISCSDSRISPLMSLGLTEGEMFIHRNVANQVLHGDLNCLSALQFAVDVLKTEHIIVCGHYSCGGVAAAFEGRRLGLADNWLLRIKETMFKYRKRLDAIVDDAARMAKLCELNVIEQVITTGETTIVQDAWSRGQPVSVHGWIYRISEGTYRDMNITVNSPDELNRLQDRTVEEVGTGNASR